MTDLDDAYANAAHIAGAAAYPDRWAQAAETFRAGLGGRARLGLSYGPTERMALDHFLPEGTARGTLVFVHGGYWLKFHRMFWSHFAAGALARGWAVAMPSYDLCPAVRIAGITQQIAQAVIAIAEGSTGPLALAGHSAGGHLVARMLAPGMLPRMVLSRVHQVVPISPVADLEPLLRTTMNAQFGLDTATARAESPVHQPPPDTPVTVWVGGAERPAFVDQAMQLAAAWSCDLVTVPGQHHFDVIDPLADPDSDLVRCLTG